jgi:uncharacterized protein YndB with AHSA1/START domain
MPVKKDASGRRYVQAEAEVPGTPEEVWKAIATGPGVSSWFVPSEIEGKVGGKIIANFGPNMESTSTITAWDPPRKFAAESRDMGPGSPEVATEWIVEARGGGTCVVRVVHSWFLDTDDWDNQFEGTEHGWVGFFRILRIYLAHFRGLPCTSFQLMGMAPDPAKADWPRLMAALGLEGAAIGARVNTSKSAPPLSGVVENIGPADFPELLLRIDSPAPGVFHIFKLPMGGSIFIPIRGHLYGETGRSAAPVAGEAWQEWINRYLA